MNRKGNQPKYNIQIILASDQENISKDSFSYHYEVIHLTQSFLFELLNDVIIDGSTISSRIYRNLNFSSHYKISTIISNNNSMMFLPNDFLHRQLNSLDRVFSSNLRPHYQNIYFVLYLPDTSVLKNSFLRILDNSELPNDEILLNCNYFSGFDYDANLYQVSFLILNNYICKSSYGALRQFFHNQLRRYFGLDSIISDYRQDCSNSNSLISTEEITMLRYGWLQSIQAENYRAVSQIEKLVELFNHVPISQTTLSSYKRQEFELRFNTSNNSSGVSLDIYHRSLTLYNHLHDMMYNPEYIHHGKLPTEHYLIILAPFWIPLLAPIIKWMMGRYRIRK